MDERFVAWGDERERERVAFTLNGTCFGLTADCLSVVISYKGFALGNLYSNLKKIFWAFLLDFSFFGWIISFNLMLLQGVNGSRGVQTGCVSEFC